MCLKKLSAYLIFISNLVLQVIVYKSCPATNALLEFAKFDVANLIPGCDIIIDAQVQVVP
jgi:hypothetical protein